MKVMRKTRICMALAAALGGVAGSGQVGAVNLSQDNIGDALIFPYYTVRDGWTTEFFLINTSDSTVVTKVRFHEARNSREVLDFTVVLSPKDMFSGWVADTANGPEFRIGQRETSCVVPEPNGRNAQGGGGSLPFSNVDYTQPHDNFFQDYLSDNRNVQINDIDRAREGYFTIIEEGAATPGDEDDSTKVVPYNSKHHNSVTPRNCDLVVEAFSRANIVDTYNDFGRNLNALKGNYALVNANPAAEQAGIMGAGTAVTLANFATVASDIPHTLTSVAATGDLVGQARTQLAAVESQLGAHRATLISIITGNPAVNPPVPPQCGGSTIEIDNSSNDDDPADLDPEDPLEITGQAYGDACDGLEPPAEDPAVAAAFDGAVSGWNSLIDDHAAAQAAVNQALAAMLAPANNLIHAQYADNQFNDHRWPNLDSGDRIASMLIDGLYSRDGVTFEYWGDGPPPQDLPFPYPALYTGHFLRGVDAVTALLMKDHVYNEWAQNPNTEAYTDWVLTAPTKSFYVDIPHMYTGAHTDLVTPLLTGLLDVILRDSALPPFEDNFAQGSQEGSSCDPIDIGVWNMNERNWKPGGVNTSPYKRDFLCWETNVLNFGGFSVLGSIVAQTINTTDIGAPEEQYNGWLDLVMNVPGVLGNQQYHPAVPLQFAVGIVVEQPDQEPDFVPILVNGRSYIIGLDHGYEVDPEDLFGDNREEEFFNWVQLGMPYIGFAFKDKQLGQNAAYGGLMDHSYSRAFEGRNAAGGTASFDEIEDFIESLDGFIID